MKVCRLCDEVYEKAKRDLSTREWPPVYRCPNCGCVENYKSTDEPTVVKEDKAHEVDTKKHDAKGDRPSVKRGVRKRKQTRG